MRIVLVDDHSLFAEGLKTLLADIKPAPLVSLYSDCEEALNIDAPDSVDLILLDYYLTGLSELEALNSLRNHFPDARIIVVSAEDNPAIIRSTIDAGAAGYIPKTATYALLSAALELVASGGTYLPPDALTGRGAQSASPAHDAKAECPRWDDLSRRQKDVLQLVVQGLPNKAIARRLEISEHTVKAHVSASFRSLGVSNRTEAVYVTAGMQRTVELDD
jgi:DNA-binding NarL/FixJ family response regulator